MVDRPLLHLFQTQTIELTLGIAQVAWGQYTSHVQILPGRGVNYSVVHLKGISFLIAISHMIKDFKLIIILAMYCKCTVVANVITQNRFIEGKDHTMSGSLVKG